MSERRTLRNKKTGSLDTLEKGEDGQWRVVESVPAIAPVGMGDVHRAEAEDARQESRAPAWVEDVVRAKPQDVTPAGVQAAVRGAVQGASMRAADEASGLGAWLAGKAPTPRAAGRGISAPLIGENADPRIRHMFPQARASAPTDYTVERDAERRANATAAEQHPVMYATGELAGSAAPAVALGAGGEALGAAAQAPRLVTAAGTGAAFGAAQGAGESTEPTAQGVARDTATGAGVGAVLGVGGELAAPLAARGLRAVGGSLRNGADLAGAQAVEQKVAAMGAERGAIRKLRDKPGGLERYAEGAERLGIGRNRLGVIPATVRQHAADAEAAAASARATKNALSSQIEAAGVLVDGHEVADRLRALSAGYGKGAAGKDARALIEDIASDYERLGRIPFSEMNTELQVWGDATNFDAGSVKQGLRKKIYGVLNEAMADAASAPAMVDTPIPGTAPALRGKAEGVDADSYAIPYSTEAETVPRMGTVPPPRRGATPADPASGTRALPPPAGAPEDLAVPPASNLGQRWRAAKEDEHIALTAQELGENRLNTAGNRNMSPTDYMAGAGAYAAAGDPVTAGGAVVANKMLRSREHAIAHQLARGAQRALGAGAIGAEGAAGALEGASAGARGVGAAALGSPAMSQESAAEADAMADPKYGAMIAAKPQADRAFVIGTLNASDPEFRARQRAAAEKRRSDNNGQ